MYYSIGPGLGPTSLGDDDDDAFWLEVFRRVVVSDAYYDHGRADVRARVTRWIYMLRAVVRSVRLPVRVENKTFRLSDDEPWNGKPRARIHQLSVGLGVVRRRVCLSLTSVSHACARGQTGACVRREYLRSGAPHRAVRVCVVCFATCAPLLARRDFGHNRGTGDVHTHGARV